MTPHMTSRSVRDLDPHLQLLSSLIDHVLKAVQRPWIHLYKKEVLVLVKVKPAKRLFFIDLFVCYFLFFKACGPAVSKWQRRAVRRFIINVRH